MTKKAKFSRDFGLKGKFGMQQVHLMGSGVKGLELVKVNERKTTLNGEP
jgi:hypothetical protein